MSDYGLGWRGDSPSRRASGVLSIDFGTCSTSAGFAWKGDTYWVKDPLTSLPYVPSSLFCDGGTFLVGQAAENAQGKDPTSFVREFKRNLGSETPYLLGGREYLAEDLVMALLHFLREAANQIANGLDAPALTAARVAVPATYPERRRQLMLKAALHAGFTSVDLVDEPVAAARSFGEQLADGETLLVYDLGGGTFDVALLRRVGQDYRVVGMPSGSPNLGGVDFDELVYGDFVAACADAQRSLLTSPNADDLVARFAREGVAGFCRRQKHQLSIQTVVGGSQMLGLDIVNYELDRTKFNSLISPLVEESLSLCEQMLQRAGVSEAEVGRVLMVGGSCRVPYIGQRLAERFHRPVVLAADPELAVATGGLVEIGASDSGDTATARSVGDQDGPFPGAVEPGPEAGCLVDDLDRLLSLSIQPPTTAAPGGLLDDLDRLLDSRRASADAAPASQPSAAPGLQADLQTLLERRYPTR